MFLRRRPVEPLPLPNRWRYVQARNLRPRPRTARDATKLEDSRRPKARDPMPETMYFVDMSSLTPAG